MTRFAQCSSTWRWRFKNKTIGMCGGIKKQHYKENSHEPHTHTKLSRGEKANRPVALVAETIEDAYNLYYNV